MATVQGAGGVNLEVLLSAELPAELLIQRLDNSQQTTKPFMLLKGFIKPRVSVKVGTYV